MRGPGRTALGVRVGVCPCRLGSLRYFNYRVPKKAPNYPLLKKSHNDNGARAQARQATSHDLVWWMDMPQTAGRTGYTHYRVHSLGTDREMQISFHAEKWLKSLNKVIRQLKVRNSTLYSALSLSSVSLSRPSRSAASGARERRDLARSTVRAKAQRSSQ